MNFDIECEREDDGRWLAEVPQLPGVLAYGATRDEAMAKTQVLALRVLAALLRLGWQVKRQSGSHRTLSRSGWPDFVFAFHDGEEIGPKMLARIAKHTGLAPDDL